MNRQSGSPICKTCYNRDPAVAQAVVKKRVIIEAVRAREPHLAETKIQDAIDRTTTTLPGLNVLARQVAGMSAVLEGSPQATKLTQAFIRNLTEVGTIGVPARLSRLPARRRAHKGPVHVVRRSTPALLTLRAAPQGADTG